MFGRVAVAAALLFSLANAVFAEEEGAIVLTYHVVESPSDTKFTIPRERFLQQMQYLAATGYNVIPLSDLYDYVEGRRKSLPKNAVVITVDDGWRCTYTEMYPILRRLNFPFTVFIYPKFIGQSAYALTWDQIREMANRGVDIQSHSYSHPFLTARRHSSFGKARYAEWLEKELAGSKAAIERETGTKVRFLAYPYGDYDSKVAENAGKLGYDAALTCDFGPVRQGSDPLRMKRVVIYENTSFETFRRLLGAGKLALEARMPHPGERFNPERPFVTAQIPNFDSLDPNSVGMTVLNLGRVPYSYDPRNGKISTVIRQPLKQNQHQVVVWGTDKQTGKRVEAVWSFYLQPPQKAPQPAPQKKPVRPEPKPAEPVDLAVPASGGLPRR